MNAMTRTALTAALVTVAAASAATAQIPGMPLFTNPRYGSGFRIHADMGMDVNGDTKYSFAAAQVYQGGITFAIGPVGIGANVGVTKNDFQGITQCQGGANTCNPQTKATGSALAQLRLVGGGHQNGALSVFGGISADFSGYDSPEFQAYCPPGGFIPQATCDSLGVKILTIPVGVAVGFKLGPAVVWGAPRYVFYKATNCTAAVQATLCDDKQNEFRYAVGADLPIFGVVAIRAAFDGGKFQGQNANRVGLGASVGFGGVH